VGERLAKGETVDHIVESMQQVAEGVKAAASVVALADQHAVEMPIATQVDAVVNHGRTPQHAFERLLRRVPSTEFAGVPLP
jgi:glycerol-3-phosphate dehydrogenase (NAD(P)+)